MDKAAGCCCAVVVLKIELLGVGSQTADLPLHRALRLARCCWKAASNEDIAVLTAAVVTPESGAAAAAAVAPGSCTAVAADAVGDADALRLHSSVVVGRRTCCRLPGTAALVALV